MFNFNNYNMDKIIGIINGNPGVFIINSTPKYSKRKRLIGYEINYEMIDEVPDNSIPIDSSINSSLNIKDYSLNLPVFDSTIFKCGKYKNTKILECTDKKYLAWYYNQIANKDIKEKVKEMISDEFVFINDRFYKRDVLVTPEDAEIIKDLTDNKVLKFIGNLDGNGEYMKLPGYIIRFPNYKKISFNGITYSLAGNKENHYCRLKNNNIEIIDMNIEYNETINRHIITINDFKLLGKKDVKEN